MKHKKRHIIILLVCIFFMQIPKSVNAKEYAITQDVCFVVADNITGDFNISFNVIISEFINANNFFHTFSERNELQAKILKHHKFLFIENCSIEQSVENSIHHASFLHSHKQNYIKLRRLII